jgi:hypothetical protein
MRVLVCGGRDYKNKTHLFAVLDAVHQEQPITLLIEGEARGADQLSALWASSRKVPLAPFPADWGRYSDAAGPIRNTQMLIEGRPELVVFFPGGSGTLDMVTKARKHRIPVKEG